MPTTSDYLNQLITDKEAIEDNLEERGIVVPSGATFTDLVPLVESIPSGGGFDEYFNPTISISTAVNVGSAGPWVKNFTKIPPTTITSSGSYAFQGFQGTEIEKITASSSTFTSSNFMFASCTNLETIDLSGIDISNMNNNSGGCNAMFYNCKKLENGVDFSNKVFPTSVYDFSSMFYKCEKLKVLDLSGISTTNINRNYASMFSGCKKLAVLDISNMNIQNDSDYQRIRYMFTDCGINCLQSDGAYANGIPYVYVKDTTTRDNILNSSYNGVPSTWSTNNVIVRS